MNILSVNVSMGREISHLGRKVRTGIFKEPVKGRVMLRRLNLDGDAQSDLINHGGIYKAAYVYSVENYDFWKHEIHRDDFAFGQFGHLGAQFARAMGFHAAVISRSSEKAAEARKLGAHEFIDTTKEKPGEALQKLGGARAILATAVSGRATSDLVGGLARNGSLMLLSGTPDSMTVKPGFLIAGRRRIQGWSSGQASDSTDTLRFAAQANIRPVIEIFPLEKANDAYQEMIRGKVRYRAVLQMVDE